MSNKKADNLLSIAAKGGNVASGEFCVERAVKTAKACLVICALDASDNTKKKFDDMCSYYNVPLYYYETKDNLGRFIGKGVRACVACTDYGLSNAIMKHLNDKQVITGGKLHA